MLVRVCQECSPKKVSIWPCEREMIGRRLTQIECNYVLRQKLRISVLPRVEHVIGLIRLVSVTGQVYLLAVDVPRQSERLFVLCCKHVYRSCCLPLYLYTPRKAVEFIPKVCRLWNQGKDRSQLIEQLRYLLLRLRDNRSFHDESSRIGYLHYHCLLLLQNPLIYLF